MNKSKNLNQRHKPETLELLKKAAEKTHRSASQYVEYAIVEQAKRDGAVGNRNKIKTIIDNGRSV